jgi:NhaP-type Na+/H+ and K+/H+ antiporter
VLLLGGAVNTHTWDWRAWGTALFLFAVARPLSVVMGLAGSTARGRLRAIVAWFGVRGIGSIFYLVFAIEAGLPADLTLQLTRISLFVVMLSILVHGFSVKPLMNRR